MTQIYDYDEYEDNKYPKVSYIIYYPKGGYVFNRSLNLSSRPFKKYLDMFKVVGPEYLNKNIGRLVSTQLDMDTTGVKILEIVDLRNENCRDQKILNETKKKWCDELGAVCDVRDIIDEVEVGKKIRYNVLKNLDDEFCKLSAAVYPFLRGSYIKNFDPNVKQFAKHIKDMRKFVKKESLDEAIEKNKKEIRELNIQIDILKKEKERLEKETKQAEIACELVKDKLYNAIPKDPEARRMFIEGPGELVKNVVWTFGQVRCIVAALKLLYGMSLEQVKRYFSDTLVRLKGIKMYQIEDLYRSFTDRERSALYIKTGCDIINKLVTNGRIKL